MAYPTLANLKTSLRITDATENTELQLALDMAINWVEEFCGRNWSGSAITVTDEEYDLDAFTQTKNNFVIMLKQMDIVTVTSVKLGSSTLSVSEYAFTPEGRLVIYGKIFDVASRSFNDYQWVKVTYTYGNATPKAVEGSILMLAMAYWNDRLALTLSSSSTGVASSASANILKSERIGEVSTTSGGGSQSATNGADNLKGGSDRSTGTITSISRMLNSYRKRRV